MAKQFTIPSFDSLEDDDPVSVRKYFKAGNSGEQCQQPPTEQTSSAPGTSYTAASPASEAPEQQKEPQDNAPSNANLESPGKVSSKTNTVIVSPRQKGNPLLKHIRNVPWEYGDIEPDYIMGQTTCALYLSLRYHNLFPNYIHQRLKSLGKSFELRVLLVHIDVSDPHPPLRELSQISILAECTLILAWSAEEAGRHIETYKVFESKSAELLMEKSEEDVFGKLVDSLSSIKSINRPDAVTLLSSFGTLEKIARASRDELSLHPGMGMQKVGKISFHVFSASNVDCNGSCVLQLRP